MSTDANSTSLESDETLQSLDLGAYALAIFEHTGKLDAVEICILVVLSCLERGSKGKRPGIVVPVDLLGDDKLTYAYAAAFGCTSSTILRLILSENTISINVSPELRHWVQIPLWLLLSAVVSLKFYPIFAAISYKIEPVGIVAGIIYCTYLIGELIYQLVQLDITTRNRSSIITYVPILICYGILLCHFVYRAIVNIKTCTKSGHTGQPVTQLVSYSYEKTYVKWLFKSNSGNTLVGIGNVQEANVGAYQRFESYRTGMMKRLNDSSPLRTSPRVIFTFVVSTLILLQLSITLCLLYQPLRQYAVVALNDLNSTALFDGDLILQVTDVSFYTSFATSTLIMALYSILIYRSYQRDLRRMYSGDFSFLPRKVKRSDNKDFIASSLRYSGTQIAYMFWCYVILFVVILLLCYMLALLLILPLMGKVSDQFLIGVKAIFPLVAAHYIFHLCETFLVNRYFLQNHTVQKGTSGDVQRVIAVKNRKLFSVLMYFMFFFHVIIGFLTCIRRILLGGAIGILTLARIDRSLLPRGFEQLDSGYKSYVGLIMLELYHRNPILIVFCEELRQTLMVKDKRKFISLETQGNHVCYQNSISGSELIQRRKRIQNMWFKAVTLINNPSVRRHHDGKIKRSDFYPDRTGDFTK